MGVLSLLVKLGVDSTAFEMGVKRAQSAGEKFGTNFKNAVTSKLGAALSVAAVTAYTKHLMNLAGEIKDMGEQMNLTTDEVQRLQILAGDTGVSFEKLQSVLLKFEEARLKATQGDKEAIKTLQNLKISNEDLYNSELSTIDAAIKAAKAYKESGGSADATAAMIDLYGLKLKAAGAALAEYQKTANRTIIEKENLDNLDQYNKLIEEQIRLLKALSAGPADLALKMTLGPIFRVYGDISGFLDRAEAAVRKAEIRGPSDEMLSRQLQQNPSLTGGPIPQTKNPPPIGSVEYELAKGPRFSIGGAQDPLARIGGFTGFQSAQDTAIRQAIEQTLQLKQIVKNTGKTADRISQE
jgi:hypothetical protein